MEAYRIPITIALITFPIVAFAITTPYVIHEYRKYGAINFLKGLIFYSFILYLLTAYFLVIMPLPSRVKVASMTSSSIQLTPLRFIHDIAVTSNFKIDSLNHLLMFLKKPTVYIVLFNVALTIPYGVYIRYLFNKKWYQIILYSFLLSLFFELTQLSGLYGIYPRAYRVFDVDDLILNTTGGVIGFCISPFVTFLLPTSSELNMKSMLKGKNVSLMRRGAALIIDFIFLAMLSVIFRIILINSKFQNCYLIFAIFFNYILVPCLNNTKTIGKEIIRIKIDSVDGNLHLYQLLIRNIILSYVILYPSSWLTIIEKMIPKMAMIIIICIIIIIEISNLISYFIKKDNLHLFLYEKISKTKNISTIDIP